MAGYPELTSSIPRSGQTDVLTTQSIYLDWSTDLDTAQFQDPNRLAQKFLLLNERTNQPVALSYASYSSRQRRVELTADLEPGSSYRVIVRKGLQDSAGRKSTQDYTVQFSTAQSPLGTCSLLSPTDGVLLETEPFVFTWTAASSASGTVSYLVRFYENLSLVGSFESASTSLSLTTDSYWGVFGSLQGRRLAWEVAPRIAAASGYLYAAPTDRRTVFFGPVAPEADDASARTFYWDSGATTAPFEVEATSPGHLDTNLAAWPDIFVTFTEAPEAGWEQYTKLYRKSQLPRNDQPSTYLEHEVAGTWSLVDRTAYFTPSEDIDYNNRYFLRVASGLPSVTGRTMGPFEIQFSSLYNPYYVDLRLIRARLRSEGASMPDDLVNYYIHVASLDAKSKYAAWLMDLPGSSMLGDSMIEAWVRDGTNLRSYGVLKWTEACTLFEIYSSILVDEIRNVGRSRRLADYEESLGPEFLEAIKAAKQKAADDMDHWDDYISVDGQPRTSSRQSYWDYHNLDRDMSLDGPVRGRDDFLHRRW